MHNAEWIALLTPILAMLSVGVAGVIKLTRMTVALEQLTESMNKFADKAADHESRIVALEFRVAGRHAAH